MFNEKKTTDLARYFLAQAPNHSMPYISAIKLMYLIDRKMLEKYGKVVTGDRYYSMKLGPVLSNAMDLMRGDVGELMKEDAQANDDEFIDTKSYWAQNIQTNGYNIKNDDKIITSDEILNNSDFSKEEKEVIQNIYKEFGKRKWRELVGYTHDKNNCPEWKDPTRLTPSRASIPLPLTDILEALGKDDEEILKILLNQ